MNRRIRFGVVMMLVGVLAGVAADRIVIARQQQGLTRTILQRADIPTSTAYEAVMALAELAPGASSGKHRHPGFEMGYVLEGSLVVHHAGRPDVTLKAGDSLKHDAVHDVTNPGKVPAKAIGIYIIEKGKPIAEPAK
jgi:quercetin dioxygenase-like cupin family protein